MTTPKRQRVEDPTTVIDLVKGLTTKRGSPKGASPPTVQAPIPESLSSSNDHKGEPKSSIVMKRLKDLCSMKELTVNVGIEIVGAAYLLKLMNKRGSCNGKIIGPAMKQAVKATKQLFHADHLRNDALQQLSKSQELFDKFL